MLSWKLRKKKAFRKKYQNHSEKRQELSEALLIYLYLRAYTNTGHAKVGCCL